MNASNCVICLSQLEHHDIEFPLLCPTKCTNVCSNCLSHLKLKSTSGDSGNSPAPTYLCPKCRAEMSPQAFADTQFMRSVRKLEELVQAGTSDSEMSGAELRMKYSVTPTQIESTKRRLEEYESGTNSTIQTLVTSAPDSHTQQQEQQGPKSRSSALSDKIDTLLLGGLESFISEEEQVYITELMTSGDTRKLAQAAQILSEIKRLNDIDNNNQNPLSLSKPMASLWTRTSSGSEKRAMQMAIPSGGEGNLPPMPKHVVLRADFDIFARHGKILKFKDDVWDGSMADAFVRVYVKNSSSHSSGDDSDDNDNENENEEGLGDEDGFLNDGDKKKNRVLVTAARGQAARAGIKERDVVTHVNNDEFLGNVEDLKAMIQNYYLDGDTTTFTMVLNAEQSTADALKKRAKH
jgi:hypothetical protein